MPARPVAAGRTVNDLVNFLRARLDEDAAAIEGLMEKSLQDSMNRDEFLTHQTMVMLSGVDRLTVVVVNRQLRDVESKRRIMELHDGAHECSTYDHNGEIDNCTWVTDWNDCSTMRLLALPYADHPDYRGEWRT